MTRATVEHGSATTYAHNKCRCDLCRAAVAEYQRKRKAAQRAGTWEPGRPAYETKQCTGPECERTARYVNPRPLCSAHYGQLFRGQELTPLRKVRRVADGMKQCNRCEEVKPVDEFAHAKGKISSSCLACQSILNRMRLYGLTEQQVRDMLTRQCAICESTDRLHVDHDHDTGRVRGMLCHNCNTVLTTHMTPAILRRMADYLET